MKKVFLLLSNCKDCWLILSNYLTFSLWDRSGILFISITLFSDTVVLISIGEGVCILLPPPWSVNILVQWTTSGFCLIFVSDKYCFLFLGFIININYSTLICLHKLFIIGKQKQIKTIKLTLFEFPNKTVGEKISVGGRMMVIPKVVESKLPNKNNFTWN